MKHVRVRDVIFGNDLPFVFIAGPCQIESRDHSLRLADQLALLCRKAGVPFVFKSSYDKANRTSLHGPRGIGLDAGLRVLDDVRTAIGCPILTDVHDAVQALSVGQVADIIQIPAFLSRQTDLLVAAGQSGAAVNIKKGQFLAPWDIEHVAAKIASEGNERILLCERGVSFGYNTLVNDFRALAVMSDTGYPVVFDATHSVQEPGGRGGASGGKREFAPLLARAAIAAKVAAVFAEVHEDPDHAPSDGANMLRIEWVEDLLGVLTAIDRVVKSSAHPHHY